jgi:CpeS-like protein
MTDTPSTEDSVQSQEAFPPTSIAAFLRFSAGEWLSLRSRFTLGVGALGMGALDAEATAADHSQTVDGPADGETWHSSERGELSIAYLSPDQDGEPGGLGVSTKNTPGQHTQVIFSSDGCFRSGDSLVSRDGLDSRDDLDSEDGLVSGTPANDSASQAETRTRQGQWTLWPDGSLELVISTPTGELSEKIWFTKPNLRLRSTVETRADGAPGRASFCSEIRRVSRPAA